jgi:hypothetical protein
MTQATDRIIPESYDPADLRDLPECYDITPEMIDYHIKQGRKMRSMMLVKIVSGGWRMARNGLSALGHRLFGGGEHASASR